jgi:hypothetical protein
MRLDLGFVHHPVEELGGTVSGIADQSFGLEP